MVQIRYMMNHAAEREFAVRNAKCIHTRSSIFIAIDAVFCYASTIPSFSMQWIEGDVGFGGLCCRAMNQVSTPY
jgi:hypothetical protein